MFWHITWQKLPRACSLLYAKKSPMVPIAEQKKMYGIFVGIMKTSGSVVVRRKKLMLVLDACLIVDCHWVVSLQLKFPMPDVLRKYCLKDLCGLFYLYVRRRIIWMWAGESPAMSLGLSESSFPSLDLFHYILLEIPASVAR